MEFKYRAFIPTKFGQSTFVCNGQEFRGVWGEGVYFKHTKIMPNPCGDGDVDMTDNIEHLLVMDGMADWHLPIPIECKKIVPESLCLITPYKTHNQEHIIVNDVVRIQYREQSKEYIATGLVQYIDNKFVIDCGKMIDAANLHFLKRLGNILEMPSLKFQRKIELNNILGTIVSADWYNTPYRTHRLRILDYEGNEWIFGNLNLTDIEKSRVWAEHLQRMFGINIYSNTICGQSVYLYFENGKPVALYTMDNGLAILDIRNIFDEL